MLRLCLFACVLVAGHCAYMLVHPKVEETYEEVLNYHKSVHLFYQDWVSDYYGRANLTAKEREYYNNLLLRDDSQLQHSHDEVFAIVNALSKTLPNEKLLKSVMELFERFHQNLTVYLEDEMKSLDTSKPSSLVRKRRQVDDKMSELLELMEQLGNLEDLSKQERRAVRQPIRQAIRDLGNRYWRKFLRLRRQRRKDRLSDSAPPSDDSNAPPPSPGDVAAPPPPPDTPVAAPPPVGPVVAGPPLITPSPPIAPPVPPVTEEMPDENIPTPKKEDEPILVTAPAPPPPVPPISGGVPPPPPPQAPPAPPNQASVNSDGIPVGNEADVEHVIDSFNRQRKRRSIAEAEENWNAERLEFSSLSEEDREKLEAALKWMMTEKPEGDTGLTNYQVFVREHRMTEQPQAYSKEDSFHYHSHFLRRFELALQQYDSEVRLPYLDICQVIDNPSAEKVQYLNTVGKAVSGNVIPECSWIGTKLKRSVTLSGITLKKLSNIFQCSTSESPVKSLGMEEYATIHSMFGLCVAGGSHMACPTCAVSDPIFWLLYANMDRLYGQASP